jgi:hypothetical protein
MEKGLMKKRAIFGLLAFALVIGFGVTGCDTTTGSEKDSWTDVKLADIEGLWEGSSGKTLTIKELDSDEWSDTVSLFGGDIPVNIVVNMTIDADENPQAVFTNITQIFSFADIVKADPGRWEEIKELFKDPLMGARINDKDHSITIKNWRGATDSELPDSGLQINQNGTKIKVPPNWLEEDTPELILIKQ